MALLDEFPLEDAAARIAKSAALATLTNGCVGTGCTQTKETYAYNKRLQPVTVQLGTSSTASAYYSLAYGYAGSATPPCTLTQGAGDNGNVTGYIFTDNMNPSHLLLRRSEPPDAGHRDGEFHI